jgi:hypothetical protein
MEVSNPNEMLEKISSITVSLDNVEHNKIDENEIIRIINNSISKENITKGKLVITISYYNRYFGRNDFIYKVPLSEIFKNTYNIEIIHRSSNNTNTVMSDDNHKNLVIKIINELGKLSGDFSTNFMSSFTPKRKSITINGKQLDIDFKTTKDWSGGYRKRRKAKKTAKKNIHRKNKTKRT